MAEIDRALEKLYDSGSFSGAVLVARNSEIIYQKNVGFASYEHTVPVTNTTKFELASLTKPFTALLVLQLVEKGVLKLDAKVSDYIPEFTRNDSGDITIHHLLSHTSGLQDFLGLNCAFSDWKEKEFLAGLQKTPILFKAGSRFSYASSTYVLLRFIIEKVTGTSYEKNLQDNIFKPCGMKNSGVIRNNEILAERALGYIQTNNGLKNALPVANHDIFLGAASIYSTASDLFLFDKALYTDNLLANRTRELMFTAGKGPYGYGWFIEEDSSNGKTVSHGGDIFGYTSLIRRSLKDRTLIIMLGNLQSIDRDRVTAILDRTLP